MELPPSLLSRRSLCRPEAHFHTKEQLIVILSALDTIWCQSSAGGHPKLGHQVIVGTMSDNMTIVGSAQMLASSLRCNNTFFVHLVNKRGYLNNNEMNH
eukprot:scaffold949_cov160-Skeletonema_dohrnii-CCMP3373.AAC.2